MRVRSACLLTLSYLLCVLASSAVLAFGDGSHVANCLANEHHGVQVDHVRADAGDSHMHTGAPHSHGEHAGVIADGGDHPKHEHHGKKIADGQCCGIACVSALPATGLFLNIPDLPRGSVESFKLDVFAEHDPAQLFRPPLSPLSH
jgi:hypothetical protein